MAKPDWLLLDEATASLDEANEQLLYRALAEQLPNTTLLSIAHHPALRAYHGDVLAMNVIEKIHARMPNLHLVMHGSSSVPQELQDIINKFGGQMKETWGVPVEEIQRGIKHGVRKINIDTDNRMAITGQIRKVLTEHPGEFDPRKYLKPALEAMSKICRARLEEFGTAGQASKMGKIIPLSEMAKKYAKGDLDPKFS